MKLAAWRQKSGLTQSQLAQQLGCTQSYISQIERATGGLIPGPAIMIEIYTVTEGAVQPNDFYDLPSLEFGPSKKAA